ncbi:hypothetical protein ABW21_db0202853 [Orbilia brochopaga]|nr:hypothetical protein ABW21_db0202853 [Drechslerella brochopaga]
MGAWSRDYSYLKNAANRNNTPALTTSTATPSREIGILRREFEDRFNILSPLAKMRIVPQGEMKETKETSTEKYEENEAPSAQDSHAEEHAERKDHESDTSDQEDENDTNQDNDHEETTANEKLQEYQQRVEKRRRQEQELHHLQQEKLRRQQQEQEKQETEAREQAERERRRLLIEQRRQSNARRRLQTHTTNNKSPNGKTLARTPRVSLRRVVHTPKSQIPVSIASARTGNKRTSRILASSRKSYPRRISVRMRPRIQPNYQNPQSTASKPRKSRNNPPSRSTSAQQSIAAARARCLAASSALVQQRKSEREATQRRIEQDRQARQQAARDKVEAERRRTAASRQRQQEAFQSIQKRVKLTAEQQSPSKVIPRFLQPLSKQPPKFPKSDAVATHNNHHITPRIPRKLWDWQTRRAHKIESIRDLFSLTHLGQSSSRTFTPLPKHIQISNQFATLEKEIYLPAIPPVAKDDLLFWKLNSADIDVTLRIFKPETLQTSLEASITQPWADRAIRIVRNLPDHLYYVWRICHNYGYFNWKTPAATPRMFAQARTFGELDREWDEVIAAREVRVQKRLEQLGLEEKVPLVRLASGYQ